MSLSYFYAAARDGVTCGHRHRSHVAAERCARRERMPRLMQWMPPRKLPAFPGRSVLLRYLKIGA